MRLNLNGPLLLRPPARIGEAEFVEEQPRQLHGTKEPFKLVKRLNETFDLVAGCRKSIR